MNINSKKRAFLKGEGSKIEAILRIGKDGLTENVILSFADAIKARELVKVKVLNNSLEDIKDVAETIAEKTGAEIIHIMGGTVLFFKENIEKPTISIKLKEIK